MSQTTKNTEIVRHFVNQAWNDGNLDAVERYLAADFVRHDPTTRDIHGRDGYKEFIEMNRTTFPDYHETIDSMISEGDTVMYRWTFRGTQKGDFLGVEPTGKEVEATGMVEMRLEDDEIIELWDNFDALGVLEQLGAIPEQLSQ